MVYFNFLTLRIFYIAIHIAGYITARHIKGFLDLAVGSPMLQLSLMGYVV